MSEHHHHHEVSGKNLFITIVLNVIITVSQIIGGIFSGSLALLSDAMHNFSDVLALLIAYVANRLAAKESTKERTFGYKRAEIIAALFNASVLIGIAIFLIIEAFHKFYHPEAINSVWVIGLGLLSIVLNAVSVLLIKDDAHGNMNMKAAYLHLLTDVMTSVAVVGGGILMYYFGLFWIDPLISAFIAL
jgi:cobalt-zinc-cadmium efflux system protein